MSAPRGHWLLGHLPAIRRDPLGLLDACSGQYARLQLGRSVWLLLDPADVAHVLDAKSDTYSKGRAFRVGRRLYGNSLLVSEGDAHREQARVIGGVFHRHAARSFIEPAAAIAEQLCARWQAGQRLDLWTAMNDLTLALSSRAIFGDDWLPSWLPGGSSKGDALRQAFDVAMSHVARQNFSLFPLPDWLPLPSVRGYHRAIDTLDHAFAESVSRRSGGGLLGHLLEVRDEAGQPLSRVQLRDQCLVLMLGGYESTATSLCWTLLLLDRHSAVRERLLQEVHTVVGDRLPTAEDVRHLPFTGQVFSESLRLYPPPWLIPRTAVKADRLPSGLELAAGTQVFLSPYRTQREERYFPDPLRFDPDRFGSKTTWPDGVYYPFGGGSRRCIGESVARSQVVLLLATVCRRWRFHCEGDELPRPLPLLTLRPQLPLSVVPLPPA